MKYKISLYCPDSHILYDINTLNHKGVGGGITSRIRLAHALARLDHDVTVYVNCPYNKKIQGVRYIHHSQCKVIDTDVFIASTSGGEFDLGRLQTMQIATRLKILMLHGVPLPNHVNYPDFDFIYFPSNFVRAFFCNLVQLRQGYVFTSYHGVHNTYFKKHKTPRDHYNLVYIGHPEKGLEDALSIMRILRKSEPRFTLHVFGGHGLWGNTQIAIPPEPGLVDHGLIGQKKLIPLLQKMSISLNLQAIQEGFGLAVCESMRAGCIVLASRVGAYPEVIRHGYNGFLIDGPHTDPATHEKSAQLILELTQHPDFSDYLRQNAMHTPFSWLTIAKTWQGHWDWALSQASTSNTFAPCSICAGAVIPLADGFHCVDCGNYQPSLPELIAS